MTENEEQIKAHLRAIFAVQKERSDQDRKWGLQAHSHHYWLAILAEELGEVAKEIQEQGDPRLLEAEIIQVAAVAVAWLEDMYRRELVNEDSESAANTTSD